MNIRRIVSRIGGTCFAGVLLANTSWGATSISVTTAPGYVGLYSTAYDGATVLASSTWAGAWNATIVPAGDAPAGHPVSWLAFCTDIGNTMSGGNTYQYQDYPFAQGNMQSLPPNPDWVDGGGSRAAGLYSIAVQMDYSALNPVLGYTTAQVNAALAIAIWEVLYETEEDGGGNKIYSVSSRAATGKGFQVNAPVGSVQNGIVTLANSFLTMVTEGGPATTWWAEADANDPQSLLGPPSMVPETSTYIAGLLLGIPVVVNGVRSWRRRRSS